VLPPNCPMPAKADLIDRTCNGGGGCISHCEAVRAEKTFYKDPGKCP
jgi:hypothetical protein